MRDITTPAEWVTAIATSLAVIVALGVALSEPWRQRRREERQQARAVHAWTAPANFNPDSPHTRDFHTYGWAVHLFNGSNRPVFDLSAVFRARGASGKETSTPVLPAPYQPLLPTGDAAQP